MLATRAAPSALRLLAKQAPQCMPAARLAAPASLAGSSMGRRAVPQLRTFASSSRWSKVTTRFTAEHEWVKFDDALGDGTIGITDYAQKSLGDVVFVELPSEGSEVQQGEQIGAVESVKAASDIYSPVTGKITSVNDKLGDQPGLLNKAPEGDGWLCKIQLMNPQQFDELLDHEAYKKLTEDA